jgi:hypothetical protein
MSSQPLWQRALNRYADTVYRLALLREGDAVRAAKATVAAFNGVDWHNTALDEHVEARLLAALPPPRRYLRRPTLPPVPAGFWRLSPPMRLAVGLRLTRGYNVDDIALALRRLPEEARRMLVQAIAALAGDDAARIPEACLHSRMARLDDPTADRAHFRGCDACREAAPRWEEVERTLGAALTGATGSRTLPRPRLDAIAAHQQGPDQHARPRWQQPGVLSAAVALVATLLVGLLVAPRQSAPALTRTPATPRELLQKARDLYGAAPTGDGIVHRRYLFDLWPGEPAREAETWTDAAEPARHRMQIRRGKQVVEWQSADGQSSARYLATTAETCGAYPDSASLELGAVASWQMQPADQSAFRAARWRFGPWAIGRRYIDQALAAADVRSLGTVREGDDLVLRLSAGGPTISGTLLLNLDARTADLREVREVTNDNGATRSRTPWKLAVEERITPEAERQAGVFFDVPVSPYPKEIKHAAPLIDPACPILSDQAFISPIGIVGRGWPVVVGLPTPPAGTRRIYLAGSRTLQSRGSNSDSGDSAALVYVGDGKRLQITAGYNPTFQAQMGVRAGDWLVTLQPRGMGQYAGIAAPPQGIVRTGDTGWSFTTDGWSREELLQLIANARSLRLQDLLAQRTLLYDPDPPPSAVLDLVVPALDLARPHPGRVRHSLVEQEIRDQPGKEDLRDPYHARPPGGIIETWAAYDVDGKLARFRSQNQQADGAIDSVSWGDGASSQRYDARTGLVRRFTDGQRSATRYPSPWIDSAINDIFRYRQFQIREDGAHNRVLHVTLPVTATDLRWAVQSQRGRSSGVSSWPWLGDLDVQTVTYLATFDRTTKRLLSCEVFANGRTGAARVQRIAVRTDELLQTVPDGIWSFTPPAMAQIVEMNPQGSQAWQGPRMIQTLPELLAVAPTTLWGWPDGDQARFVNAMAPGMTPNFDPTFATLDTAVASGAAVSLRYDLGAADKMTLLQGSRDVMRDILQQTPPIWAQSEERTLRVGNVERKGWILRGARRWTGTGLAEDASAKWELWTIFELDDTLVVAHYQGAQVEAAVLASLERLVQLN